MADSNRAATGRVDGGRAAPSSAERQAAALERIATAAETIAACMGQVAGMAQVYKPALDRAVKLADSPAARVASALGGRHEVGDAITAYGRAPESHKPQLAQLIRKRDAELECGHDLDALGGRQVDDDG